MLNTHIKNNKGAHIGASLSRFSLFLASVLLFACSAEQNSKPVQVKATQTDIDYKAHFAENGFSIPLTSFVYPSGEYYKGVTYVAYQGLLEDPYIAAYNHETGKWTGPVKIGVSEMGKDPKRRPRIDNHGQPALIIDDEGYIHIVYGGHGGTPKAGENTLGDHNYGRSIHKVSAKPLDITSWKELDNISPFGTYTQWIKMDNGDIYLFYRHGAHRSNWVYQKSTDNGLTFTDPISILKTRVSKNFDGVESWYGWFTKAKGDKIIGTINFHTCRNGGRPTHRGERQNGYYMYMDTKKGTWHNIHNEQLSMPLIKDVADEKILALDTGEKWTHTEAVQMDSNGYPHMTIRMGADIGRNDGGPKNMHYLRWTGKEWFQTKATNLPVSKGDIRVHSPTEISLWLQSRDENNNGELNIWKSDDAGESFRKTQTRLKVKDAGLIISSFVRNAHPKAQIIAAEDVAGTDLRRMYLVGEDGPVERPAADFQ